MLMSMFTWYQRNIIWTTKLISKLQRVDLKGDFDIVRRRQSESFLLFLCTDVMILESHQVMI